MAKMSKGQLSSLKGVQLIETAITTSLVFLFLFFL